MPEPRRVASFLDLAAADATAALVMGASKNRYAAYHCQQAVEKLVKAVLLHRGKEAGVEHHLDMLIADAKAIESLIQSARRELLKP
ncbi:MAG: HEPN domain-containing protein [Planctomycetes bacterium]|nr:HEPN domain-containing protein [Planctomycetota bacterium]